jgi:hypothetical protein
VPALLAGATYEVTFGAINIEIGQPINLTLKTHLFGDQNILNNTYNQYSLLLTGVKRNVLLEQWTSSTCAPCASNNPTIDAFVSSHFDSIVAVKYHVGWPSPGNDPMYLHNPTQSYDRRYYYGVNSVPHVIMDGVVNPDYPYSNAPSLPNAYNPRSNVATPVSMSVTDTRIAGDSIRAVVNISILSPLKFGSYKLRVQAVERLIRYAIAPGSNGEKDFYDVFRRSYPNSTGTTINLAPGNYSYTFTYKVDNAVWVDSMIYTIAFLQNDLTKEVINSAKGRNHTSLIAQPVQPAENSKINCMAEDITPFTPSELYNPMITDAMGGFNFEFFETAFPPAGWRVVNPDAGITYEQFVGANGPSFAGNKSVRINFYSYSTSGQRDTLYSRVFSGLEPTDTVKFDWAYAVYTGYADSLKVLVSTDGGATFPYEIFRKGGAGLATAPATTSSFVPTSSQWLTYVYPLTDVNVPVELTAFNASVILNEIQLNWRTETELNNFGFEVERSTDGKTFAMIGFVKGNGTTTSPVNYTYKDIPVINGTIYYRLRQVDLDGRAVYSGVIEVLYERPYSFSMDQNYPNPFNPKTSITFEIAKASPVSLKIYDMTGQEIAVLADEVKQPGRYEVNFDASGIASGVYFYRLSAGEFTSVKKMCILK